MYRNDYLTQDDLNTIYDFLSNNRNGEVIGGKGIISFVINKKNTKRITGETTITFNGWSYTY